MTAPQAHAALEKRLNPLARQAESPNRIRSDAGTVRVLLIGHDAGDDAQLRRVLAGPEWSASAAQNLADAVQLMKRNAFSVAICESKLSDGTWRDLLNRVASLERAPRVIVASRLADVYLWVEALNAGAYDVLSKPFSSKEILRAVGYASAYMGR